MGILSIAKFGLIPFLAACASLYSDVQITQQVSMAVECQTESIAALQEVDDSRTQYDLAGSIVDCVQLILAAEGPEAISDHTIDQLASYLEDPVVGIFAAVSLSYIGPRAMHVLPELDAAIESRYERTRDVAGQLTVELAPDDYFSELCRAKGAVTSRPISADPRCERIENWIQPTEQ